MGNDFPIKLRFPTAIKGVPNGKNNYFINSPLVDKKLSSELFGIKYYDKPIHDENGFTVYGEGIEFTNGETVQVYEKEITELFVTDYANKYVKNFEKFNLVLFASPDGVQILSRSDEVEAKDNEIILFLEVNDKGNYFGSVMRAKVGSKVSLDDSIFGEIFKFANEERKVNLNPEDIKELINKSNFKNKGRYLVKVLNILKRPMAKVSGMAFDVFGDVFKDKIPKFFDENLYIQSNRWDPNEKGYNPLFISKGLELIILQAKRLKLKPDRHFITVVKPIKEIIDNLDKQIDNCTAYINQFLPRFIARRINKAIRHVKQQLKDAKDLFTKSLDWLIELIETGFEMANAFICGLLNSFTDTVKSIFELIGLACSIAAAYNKAKSDVVFAFSILVEMIENILEAIFEFDLLHFLKQCLGLPVRFVVGVYKILKDLPSLGELLNKLETSLSKIAYFCGYIVGFIIQIIIEALLTGGVAAAENIAAKIAQFLKNPVAGIGKGIRAVKEVTEDISKAILATLSKFFKKLRSGGEKLFEEFKQWVDEVLSSLKKKLGITDEEFIQESKRFFNEAGFEILPKNLLKKYIDDAIIRCSKKGIKLEIKWIDETHPEYNSNLMGRLDINMSNKKLIRLNLRADCPKITWYHENWHLDDFIEMGWKKYTDISKTTPWLHEEAVWKRIYQNSNKWSEFETTDAYSYYKNYCDERGVKAILNEEMEKTLPKYLKK